MWSHSMFRDNPVPLLVVDAAGLVVLANPAAQALFARRPLSGAPLADLVDPEAAGSLRAQLADWWDLGAGEAAATEEILLRCANGPRRGHLVASVGVGQSGEPVLYVSPHVPVGAVPPEARDELTGTVTRRSIVAMLAGQVSPDAPGCVLLVDLDDFEELNEAHGVATGDEVLVEVARRLEEAIPVGAAVARWDGDAFLVLAPGTPLGHALELARGLLAAVARPMDVAGTRVVTASIGVASLTGQDADDVLTRVRWALSSAKSQGGRQVVVDGPVPRRFGRRRADLISEIRVVESQARSWRSDAERAWQEARTDALTGLPNWLSFEEMVARWPEAERRVGVGVAVLFIDVDEFGQVNKAVGFDHGNLVLKSVAATLQACTRGTDTIHRVGGEEFVVILRDTDLPGGQVVAERMRAAVERATIPHGGNPGRPIVTVSVGVAAAPGPVRDVTEVQRRANEAEKRAKRDGRNCVRADGDDAEPTG